jgi:hypothetical protein
MRTQPRILFRVLIFQGCPHIGSAKTTVLGIGEISDSELPPMLPYHGGLYDAFPCRESVGSGGTLRHLPATASRSQRQLKISSKRPPSIINICYRAADELHMVEPIELVTEYQAAQQAITELKNGRNDAALDILKCAVSRRTPPASGRPDTRSNAIVYLRANIEKALLEIEYPDIPTAIRTLQLGLQYPR